MYVYVCLSVCMYGWADTRYAISLMSLIRQDGYAAVSRYDDTPPGYAASIQIRRDIWIRGETRYA